MIKINYDSISNHHFKITKRYFIYISGIGPLAWTLNAELFPPEAKTIASPITFCFNWFCAFLVTKYEPDLESLIGASGAYFLFACICGSGKGYI